MIHLHSMLSLCATVASILAVGLLHVLEPAMSPIERTLSEYVLTRTGRVIFPLAVSAVGLAAFSIMAGVMQRSAPRGSMLAVALLALSGLAALVTAVFPADPMDPRTGYYPISRNGAIHAIAAFTTILALCIAPPLMSGALLQPGRATVWASFAAWAPSLGTLVFVISGALSRPLQALTGRVSWLGLGERISYAGITAWLLYASFRLLNS